MTQAFLLPRLLCAPTCLAGGSSNPGFRGGSQDATPRDSQACSTWGSGGSGEPRSALKSENARRHRAPRWEGAGTHSCPAFTALQSATWGSVFPQKESRALRSARGPSPAPSLPSCWGLCTARLHSPSPGAPASQNPVCRRRRRGLHLHPPRCCPRRGLHAWGPHSAT